TNSKQPQLDDVRALPNNNVLRERAVQARTGLKTTALNDAIARGEFPAPFYPTESGRTRVWLEAEVDAWLVSRLAQRGAELFWGFFCSALRKGIDENLIGTGCLG